MGKDKDLVNSINMENSLTRINRSIYEKLLDCKVPVMIAVKPAYSLAQMYIQALDFLSKSNDLAKVTETADIAEKIVEVRESVKSLRHYTDQFGRSYYVLMDKLNALTDGWLNEEGGPEGDEALDNIVEALEGLKTDDLSTGMKDEVEAHARQQYGAMVKKLISKGCQEDASNYFVENLFELKLEASNLVSAVDRLITLNNDFEDLTYDVEEIMIELSIPWVGFSPGETAHALWHIGDHDEDNFFFMGFLGWSLAVLENLQDNIDNL